jgi:hypothetical protein
MEFTTEYLVKKICKEFMREDKVQYLNQYSLFKAQSKSAPRFNGYGAHRGR